MAESFVRTMKRDYIAFMLKPDGETALANLAQAFVHYNEHHLHSALGYRPPGSSDGWRFLQPEAGTGVMRYGGKSTLNPGTGKTQRAYLWAYTPTAYAALRAVVYDFTPGRAGEYSRSFLQDWRGKLVTDDYAGYKAGFAAGITELGCMAHARRKFHDLHQQHQSQIAGQALELFGALYGIECEAADLSPDDRQTLRQQQARPLADTLHRWLLTQRQRVPDDCGTARAIGYSLRRWEALTRYLEDGDVPIDNNWAESQIRPWAVGCSNWLFAGFLHSGQRAAAIMSLIQSARLNGHGPYAYLRDVITRLPSWKQSRIAELMPHRWSAAG